MDAYKTAKDAQDMGGKPAEFAIVFASSNYDPHQTYEVIKSVLKNANIIGCSAAGEFCNLSGKAVINSICVLAIG
ncbi:MAG: FIST N-terminal domain-containing protein [Methanobacterium sp.]